jgi:threonine synthase
MGPAERGRCFSFLTHLECGRCGRRYDAFMPQGLCECGSPLLARYDLAGVAEQTACAEFATRTPSL